MKGLGVVIQGVGVLVKGAGVAVKGLQLRVWADLRTLSR